MTNNTGCSACGGTGYVDVKTAPFDYAQPCRNCGGLKTESHIPAVDRGGKMNIKEELLIVHSHTQQPVLKQAADEIERLERESALRLEHMNYAKDGIISDQAQTITRLEREVKQQTQFASDQMPMTEDRELIERVAKRIRGMSTWNAFAYDVAEIAVAECFRLRPMEDAPRDGTWILLIDQGSPGASFNYGRWRGRWEFYDGEGVNVWLSGYGPTGWLPLPPKETEKGKQR